MKKKIFVSLIIVVSALYILIGAVSAQEPVPTPSADEVNSIAENMFCPVCENIPLDVCGTEACAMWREEIADLLVLGFSEDEIYEYFYERHGDMVLALPPAKGFNVLVYVLPPVAFVVGLYFFIKYMRSTINKPKEVVVTEKAEKADDPYLEKLEEELKKRD